MYLHIMSKVPSLLSERHDTMPISLQVMRKSNPLSIGVISQGEGHRDQFKQVEANRLEDFKPYFENEQIATSPIKLSSRGNIPH